MKWEKRGLICNSKTFDLPWYKRNTMVPVPLLISNKCLRIFVAMCDMDNVGRIGYVDVDPQEPSTILGYSKEPILDIGQPGSFSENGVLPSSVLVIDGSIYLYYSAYQRLTGEVPYTIFSGVAVSVDGGNTFTNLTDTPILDRVKDEIFVRAAPVVVKENNECRVFYISSSMNGWVNHGGKKIPSYDVKQFTIGSHIEWTGVQGKTAISLSGNGDEHGISKISIWKEDDLFKAIYAIRSLSKGYRLGYAESSDGIQFIRKDEQIGIDVSDAGWDSEMITFPERFSSTGNTYLFYCGNHYGLAGMGYAVLTSRD